MKLTAFFILSTCLAASAGGNAQSITISETNVPLQKVFKEIQKQTGYDFLCTFELLQQAGNVTVKVKNVTLEKAVEEALRGKNLTYEIFDKTVVIKSKSPGDKNNIELPPPIDVRGRVVNETGEPVAGASVMLKGSNQGTNTNNDGYFELKNVDENATLVISGVNIEPYEVKVNGRSNLVNITVAMKITSHEEVVVKTNYWETKQRLNPGNISKINAKEIERQPVSNPLATLQANVPGLEIVQTSGVPGRGFKVRIRGTNSIANGNNPLYVIDGVPYTSTPMSFHETSGSILGGGDAVNSEFGSSPLNNINPLDIESIEILKDADATAIYGSRGANGVILITTKKGRAGKTKVEVSIYTGIAQVGKKIDLLDTKQYLAMRREAFTNDNITPTFTNAPDLMVWDTTRNTDWQDELIGGTANYTDGQLSISGGNENTQFLIGGGYHKETTVFPGNNYDRRISIHSTITNTSINEKLKTLFSVKYSTTATNLLNRDLTSRALTLPPNAPALFDSIGNLNWNGWNSSNENPLSYTKRMYESNTNNLIGNLSLSYNLLAGLNFKINMGYVNILSKGLQSTPISSQEPGPWTINTTAFASSTFQNWLVEPQLNYKKKLGKTIFELLGGTTILHQETEGLAQYGEGFSSESLMKNIAAATSINSSTNYFSQYRYNAVFGRINYSFDEKYILNLTGRRDGSSRFGPNKQFTNFGALGAAWIFSKESFVEQNLKFISFAKIRTSYGSSGNDQIGDYQYLDAYTISSLYQTGTGLAPSRLSNPDYSWETNRKFEAGLELGIFNDAVLMSLSYYRNRSSNQLIGFPLSPTTGFASIQGNFPAVVQNTGLELELNTNNIKRKDFSWTTHFNLSIPRNKLVAFPNIKTFPAYESMYDIGFPLTILKGYLYLGVDPTTGLYNFQDVNNDGALNSLDRQTPVFNGSTFFGGLNNNLSWKSFQLSVLLQFVKQQRPNYTRIFSNAPGTRFNQPVFVLERWQKPGDISDIQLFTTSGTASRRYNTQLYSSNHAIMDASFLRLKNISLSWSLPETWLKKLQMDNAGLFIQGQNLATLTRFTGLDPENASSSLPPLRVVTAGIKITF